MLLDWLIWMMFDLNVLVEVVMLCDECVSEVDVIGCVICVVFVGEL